MLTIKRIPVAFLFWNEIGIRQGDSMSPFIFNLLMDEIRKEVKKRRGYRMGEREIQIICYADDAIIIVENEDNLQRLIKEYAHNMVISTEKTKSIVISAEPRRYKLVVNNKIIEKVMETKYGGIKLSSNGKVEEEVQEQVNMATEQQDASTTHSMETKLGYINQ